MRGEKVNVENLSKIIKEEANRFSKKVKDLGEEWNEKLGNNKFASNLNNNENPKKQIFSENSTNAQPFCDLP